MLIREELDLLREDIDGLRKAFNQMYVESKKAAPKPVPVPAKKKATKDAK